MRYTQKSSVDRAPW